MPWNQLHEAGPVHSIRLIQVAIGYLVIGLPSFTQGKSSQHLPQGTTPTCRKAPPGSPRPQVHRSLQFSVGKLRVSQEATRYDSSLWYLDSSNVFSSLTFKRKQPPVSCMCASPAFPRFVFFDQFIFVNPGATQASCWVQVPVALPLCTATIFWLAIWYKHSSSRHPFAKKEVVLWTEILPMKNACKQLLTSIMRHETDANWQPCSEKNSLFVTQTISSHWSLAARCSHNPCLHKTLGFKEWSLLGSLSRNSTTVHKNSLHAV